MFERAPALIVLACLGTGVHQQALSLCSESSFETQIARADVVFVGSVHAVEPICEPGLIATRYRFDQVRYLKGDAATDSFVLIEQVGVCGTTRLTSEHAQEFRKDARYVVFTENGRAMACGMGHPFGIWPDSGSTIPVVHCGNRPVVAFDDHHLVVVLDYDWKPEMGVWTATQGGRAVPPPPPPNLPLSDLISQSDIKYGERRQYLSTPPWHMPEDELMRVVPLFPHQDPGTRVGEVEFLRTLSEVIARESGLLEGHNGR